MGFGDNGSQSAQIPEELKPMYEAIARAGQGAAESIYAFGATQGTWLNDFLKGVSQPQQFAQRTGGEEAVAAQFQSWLDQIRNTGVVPMTAQELAVQPWMMRAWESGGMTLPEERGFSYATELLGSPLGQAPATLQALAALENQYQRSTLPTIQNEAALAGLATSGAYTDAIARAREGVSSAMTPLLQEEMSQRYKAISDLYNLGQNVGLRGMQGIQLGTGMALDQAKMAEARTRDFLSTYLGLEGTLREIENQRYAAELANQIRQQAFYEKAIYGPLGQMLPSLLQPVQGGK